MIISVGTDNSVPTSVNTEPEYNVVEKITRSLNSFEIPIAICQKKEYNVF